MSHVLIPGLWHPLSVIINSPGERTRVSSSEFGVEGILNPRPSSPGPVTARAETRDGRLVFIGEPLPPGPALDFRFRFRNLPQYEWLRLTVSTTDSQGVTWGDTRRIFARPTGVAVRQETTTNVEWDITEPEPAPDPFPTLRTFFAQGYINPLSERDNLSASLTHPNHLPVAGMAEHPGMNEELEEDELPEDPYDWRFRMTIPSNWQGTVTLEVVHTDCSKRTRRVVPSASFQIA